MGDHEKVAAIRTRLECLQDEVCTINQEQKGLADKAWVDNALKLKADFAWVQQALRSKADHGDHDIVAALRTRLECLQDEVCTINQEQKGLAGKAWVVEALKLKVDCAWAEKALNLKADQGDQDEIHSLRLRLQCLQDEVCQIDQRFKHSSMNEALKAYIEEQLVLA